MKNFHVRTYQKTDYFLWNEFVALAKNATFLFHRDFMEYHSDRFVDFSLLVFDEKEQLKAIVPANRVGDVLYSHQGLTYGGLVVKEMTLLSEVIQITHAVLKWLYEAKIASLYLKIIPTIYTTFPSDEMEYVAFLTQAQLAKRDTLAVLDLSHKIEPSRVRKRGVDKGLKIKLEIKEVADFEVFWNELLQPNLKARYDANPVHSLAEISYLKTTFPKQIRQFNVYLDQKIVGGVTVFETNKVIHPQYVSGNKAFNNVYGGLDFLYNHLISNVYKGHHYFDFGSSTVNDGWQLNESLHYWKESFGARTVVQNFYVFDTKNYSLLEKVLL